LGRYFLFFPDKGLDVPDNNANMGPTIAEEYPQARGAGRFVGFVEM